MLAIQSHFEHDAAWSLERNIKNALNRTAAMDTMRKVHWKFRFPFPRNVYDESRLVILLFFTRLEVPEAYRDGLLDSMRECIGRHVFQDVDERHLVREDVFLNGAADEE